MVCYDILATHRADEDDLSLLPGRQEGEDGGHHVESTMAVNICYPLPQLVQEDINLKSIKAPCKKIIMTLIIALSKYQKTSRAILRKYLQYQLTLLTVKNYQKTFNKNKTHG